MAGRSDYAISCGSQQANELNPGPGSISAGTNGWGPGSETGRANSRIIYSGYSFTNSKVGINHVEDGLSKTAMIMEKFVTSDWYTTGDDWGRQRNVVHGVQQRQLPQYFFRSPT